MGAREKKKSKDRKQVEKAPDLVEVDTDPIVETVWRAETPEDLDLQPFLARTAQDGAGKSGVESAAACNTAFNEWAARPGARPMAMNVTVE